MSVQVPMNVTKNYPTVSVLTCFKNVFDINMKCHTNLRGTNTGLFKKKYTLSKIYFTKTTDAKSMSCVQMERKSLKVLI
jgi:hypothetical protein